MIIFDVEVLVIFVLLKICLGNPGSWIWMIIFDVEVDD